MAEHKLSGSPFGDLGQEQSDCPVQPGHDHTEKSIEKGPAGKIQPRFSPWSPEDPELTDTAFW